VAEKGHVSLARKTCLREDASNVDAQHNLVAVDGLLKKRIVCHSGSNQGQAFPRTTSKLNLNKTLDIIEALLPSKPYYIKEVPAICAERKRASSARSLESHHPLLSKSQYARLHLNYWPARISVSALPIAKILGRIFLSQPRVQIRIEKTFGPNAPHLGRQRIQEDVVI
jgi:hypothetical protein